MVTCLFAFASDCNGLGKVSFPIWINILFDLGLGWNSVLYGNFGTSTLTGLNPIITSHNWALLEGLATSDLAPINLFLHQTIQHSTPSFPQDRLEKFLFGRKLKRLDSEEIFKDGVGSVRIIFFKKYLFMGFLLLLVW